MIYLCFYYSTLTSEPRHVRTWIVFRIKYFGKTYQYLLNFTCVSSIGFVSVIIIRGSYCHVIGIPSDAMEVNYCLVVGIGIPSNDMEGITAIWLVFLLMIWRELLPCGWYSSWWYGGELLPCGWCSFW